MSRRGRLPPRRFFYSGFLAFEEGSKLSNQELGCAIRIGRRISTASQSGLSSHVEGGQTLPPPGALSASNLTSAKSPVPPIGLANTAGC